MKYLLDTHIAIWALSGKTDFDKDVKDILLDSNNQIFYSIVSSWEIEIKHLKYDYFTLTGEQFSFLCSQAYYDCLKVDLNHINELKNIKNTNDKPKHNDPFDKMIMAQAVSENMILITHDRKFEAYNLKNIIYV